MLSRSSEFCCTELFEQSSIVLLSCMGFNPLIQAIRERLKPNFTEMYKMQRADWVAILNMYASVYYCTLMILFCWQPQYRRLRRCCHFVKQN